MSGLRRGKQGHYSRSAKLRPGSPALAPIKRCKRQSLHRVCKVYRRSCELVCWTHPRHSHSAWVRAFLPWIHRSLCNPSASLASTSSMRLFITKLRQIPKPNNYIYFNNIYRIATFISSHIDPGRTTGLTRGHWTKEHWLTNDSNYKYYMKERNQDI